MSEQIGKQAYVGTTEAEKGDSERERLDASSTQIQWARVERT